MPRWFLAPVLVAITPLLALACSIPVFRYALERWDLTLYEVIVFHDGPLPGPVDAALRKIETAATKVNAKVIRVPLGAPMAAPLEKLWKQQSAAKSPWFVVRSSDTATPQHPVRAGELTEKSLEEVLDSPARRKLVEHLSRGVSGVFLVLPSGKEEADQQAAKLLEIEMARLHKLIRLPEPDPNGPQLKTNLPLGVEFVALTVNRNDPAEAAFVQMLLNTDEDVAKVRGPVVMPVFGRGRVLCSVFGAELNREQLTNVARFMCGKCSCEIKELNPGADLLVTADWSTILNKAGPAKAITVPEKKTPPPVPQKKSEPEEPISERADVTEQIEVSADNIEQTALNKAPEDYWFMWTLALGGAGLLVLITGLWAFLPRGSA